MEKTMKPVESLVVATDFSAAAETGLEWARAVAARHGTVTHLVHLVSPIPVATDHTFLPPETLEAFVETARERLEALAEEWRVEDLAVTCHVRMGAAAEGILDLIDEIEPGLAVVGSRGHAGFRDLLLGSTGRRVVRGASCPVLTIHPENRVTTPSAGTRPSAPREILVPVDFSPHAIRAAKAALRIFPPGEGARLTLFHAWHLPADYTVYGYEGALHLLDEESEQKTRLKERLEDWASELDREDLVIETKIAAGYPGAAIVNEARTRRADLVAMGCQGLRGLERWILGSVAEQVVQRAPCPVLTARQEGAHAA